MALTAEKYYDSSGTLTRQISYQYNLMGNRTQRMIVEGGTSTAITYNYDAANQLTTSSADTYTFDANQSVIGIADDSGQIVVRYQYSGFGEITSSTGTATTGDGRLLRDANPFRYAGYQYDTESGFYSLKSRYYIPFMGRFLTRDRVESNNGYIYCGNDPVNMTDPNGAFAAAAVYFVPGIGEVALITTGIVIGGVLIGWGASWLIRMAIQYAKGKRDTKQINDVTRDMSKRQRELYNEEIHRLKRMGGMRPNDNLPYWMLVELADEIRRLSK